MVVYILVQIAMKDQMTILIYGYCVLQTLTSMFLHWKTTKLVGIRREDEIQRDTKRYKEQRKR